MSGFGGAVKLTGESEYRRALSQITQNLREVSSEMKVVSSAFDKNDNSVQALTAKQTVLNEKLTQQVAKLNTLKAEYAAMASQMSSQTAKHNELVQTYQNESKKLEEIGKTLGTTSKEYKEQEAKVAKLREEVVQSTAAQDANEKSMSKLRVEMNNAQADINKTTREIDSLGEELKESKENAESAGSGLAILEGTLANLASQAITSVINGLKEMGRQVINLGKQAYGLYGEYEQLKGGVETLFGDSSEQLMQYAANAYKTAGLSANDYMEQATSFSATLLQGLEGDTAKAAEYANMAIIDMSDNANKMGTSMQSIQNAYQGFAKDNYTMLDNLKLGYGGTASEMARLINDSGVLGENIKVTAKDVKDVPFDKVIEAIHKTQQEIGITGTTTLEAEKTLTGSMSSMKASWENLLVAIADENQDIKPLIDTLVEQMIIAGKNSIPRIKEIVKGMGEAISAIWNEVIPELANQIPELKPFVDALNWVRDNSEEIIAGLTGVLTAIVAFKAVSFITTLVQGVMALFGALQSGIGIVQALNLAFNANPIGLIVAAIAGLVAAFVTLWNTSDEFRNFWIGVWDAVSMKFTEVMTMLSVFFTETIPAVFASVAETIGGWKDTIVLFFEELPVKIGAVVDSVVVWLQKLPYNLGVIIGQMIGQVVKWGTDTWDYLKVKVPEMINAVVKWFSELPSKIWTWLSNAYNNVVTWGSNTAQKAVETGRNFINNVITWIQQLPSRLWSFLSNAISKAGQFAADLGNKALQAGRNMFNNIINAISSLPSRVMSIGSDIVSGIWNGIVSMGGWIRNQVASFARGILDGMKSALGINSPSKVFADEVGVNSALGIGEGFVDTMANVTKDMQNAIPTHFDVKSTLGVSKNGGDAFGGYSMMVDAFTEALSRVKIELDGDVAGNFVDKTVTRLIYT